jgi:hypothetical protein
MRSYEVDVERNTIYLMKDGKIVEMIAVDGVGREIAEILVKSNPTPRSIDDEPLDEMSHVK